MKESKDKPDTAKQFDSNKKDTPKDSSIIGKLALLIENNCNEKADSIPDNIISPKKVQKKDIDDQKTHIYSSTTPDEDSLFEQHHPTHSLSLLKNLQSWDETHQINSIEPGQVIRGTYSLDSRIGGGGMGDVWKALDLIQDAGDAKDKYVAIKFINHKIKDHPDALKALVREFARYKKLIHPNIVKAYELNRDKNEIFIAMEYLKGSSLQEFIEQHPEGVPLAQAYPIIKGMCDALDYAHSEGIVHCDFKPGNIFYNPLSQVCKVIDFGIARLSSDEERDETHFDPGALGAMTTSYASSEMLMEEEPDPKDDIYSLACIVYELLSGKHPFDKKMALKAERGNLQPKQIPELSKNEFQALLHGLSFRREKRTTGAAQFYAELFAPKKTINEKYFKWSAIAVSIMVASFIAYKGYNHWHINQIRTGIQEQSHSALDNYISLPVDEQKELIFNPSFRLSLVKTIATKNDSSENILDQLDQFDPKNQQILFSDRNIRVFLITHFSSEIDRTSKENDFTKAQELSFSILKKFPDSMQLVKQLNFLKTQKEYRLRTIQSRYKRCLNDYSKNLSELFPCLQQTREMLKKIDSSNAFLTSSDLTNRYRVEVATAISNNNLSLAKTLLADWHVLEKNKVNERARLEHYVTQAFISNNTKTSNFDSLDQPKQDGLNQEIIRLLDQAKQQHAKKQLMTPLGDSALESYQEILKLDASNKLALAGINNIKETYLLWAREEIKRGNRQHAEYLFNRALMIAPNDKAALSGIDQLKLNQDSSETQQSESSVSEDNFTKNISKITELLSKADQQIANKMLVAPSKDNAWKTYKKILHLDPRNNQALAGIKNISKMYVLRARKKMAAGNYRHAGYLFDKALMVLPGNKDALSGLSSLNASQGDVLLE